MRLVGVFGGAKLNEGKNGREYFNTRVVDGDTGELFSVEPPLDMFGDNDIPAMQHAVAPLAKGDAIEWVIAVDRWGRYHYVESVKVEKPSTVSPMASKQ